MRIVDRGDTVIVLGEDRDAGAVADVLNGLLLLVRDGRSPGLDDLEVALADAGAHDDERLGIDLSKTPPGLRKDINIRPRTRGQKEYLDTIHANEMTLAIGPAGTGKTYLAMAAAVSSLLNKQVKRIILTRPAVEAGESLGFLPGDLEQKVNPYLRPLYDALYSMVDMERVQRLIDQERIEVAPLAFMRGRTLDKSFIILDEGQNTTPDQMKMFLTRIGQGSRAVITGDITQQDLPRGSVSGLTEAHRILRGIPGIGLVELHKRDVVRNPLVQCIIDAYTDDRNRRESAAPSRTMDRRETEEC